MPLIIGFLKITKKKIFVTLMFPVVAVSLLLLFFVFDEFFGLGGISVVNAGYALGNYIYLFIFLPLNFVDSDVTSSIIFKIAIIITPMWWYILSCVLIIFLGKVQKKEFAVKKQNL